jgi:hypothetical protein
MGGLTAAPFYSNRTTGRARIAGFGTGVATLAVGDGGNVEAPMRKLRSLAAGALVCAAALFITASTPRQAAAFNWTQYLSGYGAYNYPHYWNNWNSYRPYNAYNAYGNWNGNYGGYYGTANPYYNGYRNYYWNWYRY